MKSYLRSLFYSLGIGFLWISPAFAESADVAKVENFIQNIIQVAVTLAGLLAAGFFVVGGFSYIASTGNPEKLDKAKRTIMFSGVGLAVAIGALVLSNVVVDIAQKSFGS
ncbi:hypothetical protein COX25_05185 [bacterium (Candidatus Howlettbacteria) CG23_combo_of_CG06-09_8_20_14_all_37_9]|nr:MAG: hypothetical protein COX25_05185 [bacterium (Candidatus Howlettbacteria) CG23_combo_of_CG06-09_8_20_14_all_37_9]